MGCIKPHTSKQPETVMERRATRASAAEEVCLMTCELEMIHTVDELEAEFYSDDQVNALWAEKLALHQSLIIRGWVWEMPAGYHAFARGYIECGILEDDDYEENTMKPKIKIVTSYGLVTAIISEGSAIDVEIVEEDTGREMFFTSPNYS
jgi:hypothetical protein